MDNACQIHVKIAILTIGYFSRITMLNYDVPKKHYNLRRKRK